MMFWGKIFRVKEEIVLAVCDENLIDKKIKGKNIETKVSKFFYGGELIDEKIALRAMKEASIGNLMGKNIVDIAQRNGFISKENIILIDDIPHAQFVKI